jgi:HAMP domain-containing protein
MSMDAIGIALVALGAILIAFGRIIQLFIRGVVDRKIEKQEDAANEAAKESAAKLSIYRDLKRKYDELRKRK